MITPDTRPEPAKPELLSENDLLMLLIRFTQGDFEDESPELRAMQHLLDEQYRAQGAIIAERDKIIEELKAENARRRGRLEISEWNGVDYIVQRDRLREALEQYGKHNADCGRIGNWHYCTCGLDTAKGKEPHG